MYGTKRHEPSVLPHTSDMSDHKNTAAPAESEPVPDPEPQPKPAAEDGATLAEPTPDAASGSGQALEAEPPKDELTVQQQEMDRLLWLYVFACLLQLFA